MMKRQLEPNKFQYRDRTENQLVLGRLCGNDESVSKET